MHDVHRLPTYRPSDQEALVAVARWYERLAAWFERAAAEWDRVVIGICSVYLLGFAGFLTFFPYDQLLTEGTRPIFAIAGPRIWAIFYFLFGLAVAATLPWQRPALHALVWIGVAFLFGAWLMPLIGAVLDGGGSPIGALVLCVLNLLFGFAAVAHALKKR